MSVTKKIGRPREFDVESALQAAIDVFWSKGYHGASMKDLTKAMGINVPSLYSVYGDKRSLFLKAINKYATSDVCAPLTAFDSEDDIAKAIEAFFNAAIEHATNHESGNQGCFISSCVATSAGTVEGTKALFKSAVEDTDKRLTRRFDIEKEKGNLPDNFPSLERARLMFDIRQGYVLRARAGIINRDIKAGLAYRAKIILEAP